jgi:hypothetical protein
MAPGVCKVGRETLIVKITPFIIGFLLFFLFASCKQEELAGGGGPVTIDPRLFGTWSSCDGKKIDGQNCVGFQIDFDKKFHFLGVETATGKLAPLEDEDGYWAKLIDANSGSLTVAYGSCPTFFLYGTAPYFIVLDRLVILKNPWPSMWWNWPKTFYRTQLGTVIADSIPVSFSFDLSRFNDTNVTHVKCLSVSESLPAYVTRISQSQIAIFAFLRHPWETIYIEVNNFSGPGTYQVSDTSWGSIWGELSEYCDDSGFFEILNDYTNTITIDQYDEVQNRCSGRFKLNMSLQGHDYPYENYDLRLRNGTFSVPLYHESTTGQAVQLKGNHYANIHLQNTKGRN